MTVLPSSTGFYPLFKKIMSSQALRVAGGLRHEWNTVNQARTLPFPRVWSWILWQAQRFGRLRGVATPGSLRAPVLQKPRPRTKLARECFGAELCGKRSTLSDCVLL